MTLGKSNFVNEMRKREREDQRIERKRKNLYGTDFFPLTRLDLTLKLNEILKAFEVMVNIDGMWEYSESDSYISLKERKDDYPSPTNMYYFVPSSYFASTVFSLRRFKNNRVLRIHATCRLTSEDMTLFKGYRRRIQIRNATDYRGINYVSLFIADYESLIKDNILGALLGTILEKINKEHHGTA